MKKKLLAALTAKCKQYGLTPKAIEELVEIGASGLTEEATDDEIAAKVDSLVPYAKAMQGEITRKSRKKSSAKPSKDEGDGEEEDGETGEDDEPAWMKKVNERLEALETENKTLKEEKAKTERASLIADKAKKLGIPEYLVKRMSFAEDADLDKELSDLKQDLVNNNLMPKDRSHELGTSEEEAKAAAEAWAQTLPDKK
ncbi:hypothetical protein [Sangeribacter muris]|jgi:hypothetical protein|uniref:hypothetical protein n=2 Tax=Muribaculaceae TaxID=2005473 RepID=UPI00244E27F5|nr:hypothetical protein [Sangeribacter muris]